MKTAGIKSPGRRASRDKLRAIARPRAIRCPDIFAQDKQFMRLFWASKRIEHDPRQRAKFDRLMGQLYARGVYLEAQDRKPAEEKSS
jgi:hypothetical protein